MKKEQKEKGRVERVTLDSTVSRKVAMVNWESHVFSLISFLSVRMMLSHWLPAGAEKMALGKM